MRRSPRLLALAGLTLAAGALAWALLARPAAQGAALFEGRQSLAARIQGHDEPLPPAASRCGNCHVTAAVRAAAADAGVRPASFGPVLDRSTLTRAQPRRGGPPSRYDAASLCRTLRTGVDPAWVTLSRTMPRYVLSDGDCAALWAYLSRA